MESSGRASLLARFRGSKQSPSNSSNPGISSRISVPPISREAAPILRANPDVRRETLCSQMGELIIGPLEGTQIRTLIIIDALDEARMKNRPPPFSPCSPAMSTRSQTQVLYHCRPEPRIRSGFALSHSDPSQKCSGYRMSNVPRWTVISNCSSGLG